MTWRHAWQRTSVEAEAWRGTSPDGLAKLILEEMARAAEEDRVAKGWWKPWEERFDQWIGSRQWSEWLKHSVAARDAYEKQEVLRRRLALDFGERYGWQFSPSRFDLLTLAQGKCHNGGRYGREHGVPDRALDHPRFYKRGRRAAAIATHLYGWSRDDEVRRECRALAAHYGLTLLVPDFPSWHFPGNSTLVVYVGPVGESRPRLVWVNSCKE